jgi:hypothetical protein
MGRQTMLVIRNEQYQALERAAAESFVRATEPTIAERWPGVHERLGDEGVCRRLRKAVERCALYEIDDPEDILAYVNVMFALDDEDFEQHYAWAEKALHDADSAGSLKAIELADGLAAELEARADADQERDGLL